MSQRDRNDLFSSLVASHYNQLYGYIFSVVRNLTDTDDLFQTVCMVLWRKFDLFQPESNFFAWARQTAKIEIAKFLRQRPSRMLASDDLLDSLADAAGEAYGGNVEQYLAALRRCKTKLDSDDEQLLNLHYGSDLRTREIADRLDRPQTSVCRSLNRIRGSLLACIERELARQEHPS